MNSIKKISFIFLLSGISLLSNAEGVPVPKADMVKIFERINSWFLNTPAYSLVVTHASYENYTSVVPVEKSVGYFKKEKENYHSCLIGIHTIQNADYKIVIDTADKVMLVANKDQLAWGAYTPDDYLTMLKSCLSITMTNAGPGKLYRMVLPTDNPIAAYEFLIDPDGMLKQVAWYYNREVQKDENDPHSKVKPRISIGFSGYKKDVAFNYKDIFSDEPYFTKKDNKLITTAKYRGYKLNDQRVRN